MIQKKLTIVSLIRNISTINNQPHYSFLDRLITTFQGKGTGNNCRWKDIYQKSTI